MTPAQYRMARAALGWTVRQAGNAAGMSTQLSATLLRGDRFDAGTAARLRKAFEAEGIVFVEDFGSGPGVCFKERVSDGDHPKANCPATHAIAQMEAEIAADRAKRKP